MSAPTSTETAPLRIVSLEAENVKRLRAPTLVREGEQVHLARGRWHKFSLQHAGRRVVCEACAAQWHVTDFGSLTLAAIPCCDCGGRLRPPNWKGGKERHRTLERERQASKRAAARKEK